MKRTVLGFLAVCALAAVALAADASGAWSGSFTLEGSGDSQAAYAVLKQAGTGLTGAAGPSSDEQWPIEAGKVEGSKVSFTARAPDGALYHVAVALDGDNATGDITAVVGDRTMKGKIRFSRVK
jgi:hypothetical protein